MITLSPRTTAFFCSGSASTSTSTMPKVPATACAVTRLSSVSMRQIVSHQGGRSAMWPRCRISDCRVVSYAAFPQSRVQAEELDRNRNRSINRVRTAWGCRHSVHSALDFNLQIRPTQPSFMCSAQSLLGCRCKSRIVNECCAAAITHSSWSQSSRLNPPASLRRSKIGPCPSNFSPIFTPFSPGGIYFLPRYFGN